MTRSQHSRRDFLKKSMRSRPRAARFRTSVGASGRSPTPRRTTGRRSAASAWAAWASDDAREHADFGDIVAVCDVDSRHADAAKNDPEDRQGQGRRLRRLPQGARTQRHRRGEHRHARSLAREDRHRGPAGRQARLLPKAADAHARREPTDPQRLQEVHDKVFIVGTQQRSDARLVPPRRQHGAEGALGRHPKDHRGHQRQPDRRTVPQGRPAEGTRLGLLARPDAEGRLHRAALPLQVPLVVRVLGRQVHRLGRPPRRHRHLGHRAGPGRHGARSRSTAPTPSIPCRSRTAIRPWTTATTRRTISP